MQRVWTDRLLRLLEEVEELVDGATELPHEARGVEYKLQEALGPLASALRAAAQYEGVDLDAEEGDA